jgi:hypothetical protein
VGKRKNAVQNEWDAWKFAEAANEVAKVERF